MVRYWKLIKESLDEPEEKNKLTGYQAMDDLRESTGVEYFKINLESYEEDGSFYNKLRSERGFNSSDIVEFQRENNPKYSEIANQFYDEHLHEDDEVRLVIGGSGYFDVRTMADDWIRICLEAGDLLIIPAGIYHRFSLDKYGYVKCIRLFSGMTQWTPILRGTEDNPVRQNYLQAMSIKYEK